MKCANLPCQLTITCSSGKEEKWIRFCEPGGTVADIRENESYYLSFSGTVISRLYVDDEEIKQPMGSTYFSWKPGFYAGRVEVAAIDNSGAIYHFFIEVSPAEAKLAVGQFAQMVDEIREFDTQLLLGSMAATDTFGVSAKADRFEWLVALARLKQHGSAFLRSVERLSASPHKLFYATNQRLPLSSVRQLPPTALLNRQLLAAVGENSISSEEIDSIQISTQVSVAGFDTPANRALKALLTRFRAKLKYLLVLVEKDQLTSDIEEQQGRKARRLELLNGLLVRADKSLASLPFSQISKAEITSAGLTQVAAQPFYSQAYRHGTDALRSGIKSNELKENLNISPTWGIYETWCFISLLKELKVHLGLTGWKPEKKPVANAEIAYFGGLQNGAKLQALFQARFPSEKPHNGCGAWSLSKMRIPDIVLALISEQGKRFLVFDSKYRSGRENVLDAMESAHIYHDSLRLDKQRPDGALLLLPGFPDILYLKTDSFFKEHGVGAIFHFAHEQEGICAITKLVLEWCENA